jgi:hypothetical protein
MAVPILINAPLLMGFEDDRRLRTLTFLCEIREAAANLDAEIEINLADCAHIPRSVCLALAAELQLVAAQCPGRVTATHPDSEDVCTTLDVFGVYDHLGVKSPIDPRRIKRLKRDVILMRAGTGDPDSFLPKLSDVRRLTTQVLEDDNLAVAVLTALGSGPIKGVHRRARI